MKKIFSFAKKKKGFSPNSSDTGSVLSVGYEIKEKDLSKLHKAASSGDLCKLKQLAKKNDLSQLDKENRTPLHIACANGHVELVQFLVESKAKLNLCDNQNRSPLMKAVQCQQERCVITLLEHNADPNLVDINGNTALHLAALIPSIYMAGQLLEHEANANAQNKDGCTPLTLAVTENHVDMAEFLLKEGGDVNVPDQGKRTSLIIAACNGHISMVRLLLRYNADVTMKDDNGWTSDDYAVMNGHHGCSHLIIEHGTRGKTQPSPSHFAAAGKKRAAILGGPGHIETGPALGGPATDREDLQLSGAAEAGKVDEDESQAESISRASNRGGGDSWPSSDEDELDFSPKKPQKPNLKKLLSVSQKGRTDVIADVDRSSSECQSEQESEGGAQRDSSLPVALPLTALPKPASLSPQSSYKPPTSTPPSRCKKGGLSEVAFTKKPRGNSQDEGESDSPDGPEEEEFDSEDEEEEDEDEDDDDSEEEEEDEEDDDIEESEGDEEVEEEQDDDEEEEEDSMEENDVALAHIRTDAVVDEELLKPVTAGVDAEGAIEEEADMEQLLAEGHDQHQSAAATEQAVVTEEQEAMENVIHAGSRNDNNDEDEVVSKNITNRTDNSTQGILDFGEDCVVSAIRVESGFSDEEEDLGPKEIIDTEPEVLPQQGLKPMGGKAEEPTSPDMSWGDDESDISYQKESDSPEVRKSPPLQTGLTPRGKTPQELVSPDVRDKEGIENTSEEVKASMSPVLTELKTPIQKSSDKALLGKEENESTSTVDSWGEKNSIGVRASGQHDCISMSGSHGKAKTLAQNTAGTKPLAKNRDQPSSTELSWGDENDEDNEGSSRNDKALETQPTAVIRSKASDSWDSDEEDLKNEHFQPAGKVAEEQEGSVPVSLIIGHYEGLHEPGGKFDKTSKRCPGSKRGHGIHDEEDSDLGSGTSRQKAGDGHPEEMGKAFQTALGNSVEKFERCHKARNEQNMEELTEKAYGEDAASKVINLNRGMQPKSSMVAAGSSKTKEERVESHCVSAEGESDIDWGDEVSGHEQIPRTAIDDVELDPPGEEPPQFQESGQKVTEDKQAAHFKGSNTGVSKDNISTEDDEDDEDEDEDNAEETKEDDDEEDDGEVPDINTCAEDGQKSSVAASVTSEPSKDVKRDFLSELGLEGGDEEDSPWDSESGSDSPGKLHVVAHSPVKTHKVMASISEENNEALQDEALEKKPVLKAQSAPILSKPTEPKDDAVKNTDLMEELGLDDADDLEDASDWDTASTTSKNIPKHKLASPLGEEPSVRPPVAPSKDQGPPSPTAQTPPLPSPRSSNPSTTLQPQPHPRGRKPLPVKAESEEDSDWDSESGTPASSPRKSGKLQPNMPEDKAISKPDTLPSPHQLSPEDGGGTESKEELHKVGLEKKNVISVVQRPGGLWDVEGPSRQSVHESQEVRPPQTSQRPQLSEKGTGVTPKDETRDSRPQGDSSKSPKSGSTVLEQEGDGVDTGERIIQRPPSGPRQAAHTNGDPLSVFDDSTVSEVSEDDGRFAAAGNCRSKGDSEREMADDLDELTQSSDTPTEDEFSPTSGYRNASLLIQQLDSSSVDSVSMVKLQNMFHEYERTIQRERGRYSLLADKVSRLEKDRAELRRTLEETREGRSALERRQVELETDMNNLKFALKQEQEKHRNAAMLYEKSREQLRKKEEQQRSEAEERQRTELAMRNLELEKRAYLNNLKQLEEDRSEAQRMLNQERSARALQEGVLNSHLRKQKEIEEENRRNFNKSTEAMSQLSEASDRERELMQQSRSLQEEVTSLQLELDRSHAHSRQEEGRLSEESEALRERLEDVRRDLKHLKLSEEALAQTVFQCNGQLSALKAEASVAAAKLEHERQAREKLEAEAESARARLTSALQEVEHSQVGRAEAERALQRERDDWQRAQEKRDGEAAGQRETIHGLSQRLGKAEAKANSLENECHRSALALTEKTLLLETVEREREQAQARLKEQDAALLAEREQRSKAGARQEALQERLGQAQSENMLLRQQLEEAHGRGAVKERAVADAQERFGDMLAQLRSDSDGRVHMVEERSRELADKNAELREQVRKQEHESAEREAKLRQLQQELADSLKKLSMSEASLEVNTRYRSDLEEEKVRLQKEMDRLKGKLQDGEEQYVQSERRLHSLKSALDDKEREVIASAQKLQEVLSASSVADKTTKQLEEAVQRLEIENARLEATAKQQINRIEVLQKGAQEAALVRNRLEGLVTDLQGAKINLEDQLSREVQKQSVLSHNAQGSHQLWEEELKSRSRLGLRLAELEKEKEDLSTQMDIERKKVKKISEQKRSVDERLDQEMKRNTDLQKEMYRLRTLVKTAKKKLREQDSGELASPLNSLRGEMGHRQMDTDAAVGRMKADELSLQLEKEALKSSRLEAVNGELMDQLSSLKTLTRSHERLERSKRQLEEEVSSLRRQMETSMMDQNQAEQYRRETEERARQEIRHKLEEVNLFLQTQAASQETLEQIKAANEASLRSQLEQRIRDLDGELSRLRSSQQDSLSQRDSTKTELDRYRQLYGEELRLRKSLAGKLERSSERLAEANTRLLSERQRSKSLITSSIVNGGLAGPSLDMGPLGSVGTYGATLGPLNRSLNLGGSFLSPVGEGHNSRVEAYLAKMQNELEKNISKELDHAAAELEGGSARLSPVGSAAGSQKTLNVDQDPVTRATQQYLEVLKKNYMI